MENQTLFFQCFQEASVIQKQNCDDKIVQNNSKCKKDNQNALVKKNNQKNRCGVIPISYLLNKFCSIQNDFVLVGDILLQIFQKEEEEDVDKLHRQASLIQDKKYITLKLKYNPCLSQQQSLGLL
ncbi:hypothetical protein ABPG72_007419 [Tetrahymena utriculariae]